MGFVRIDVPTRAVACELRTQSLQKRCKHSDEMTVSFSSLKQRGHWKCHSNAFNESKSIRKFIPSTSSVDSAMIQDNFWIFRGKRYRK
jgi:hypothetical protein